MLGLDTSLCDTKWWLQGAENGHLKGRTCAEVGYRVYSSIDTQPWSMFGGSAGVGFARSRRSNIATASPSCMETPGPGTYANRCTLAKGVKYDPSPCVMGYAWSIQHLAHERHLVQQPVRPS